MKTINKTDFKFPNQTHYYHGKVREVYTISDQFIVMIASDRISAFDVVLSRQIPFKGQVLNQLAAIMLEATKDLVPNWLIDTPHPNVAIGHACEPFKVEMVIRGYLAGHAAREYKKGKREICGVTMPEGMKENEAFPKPIITPATKAEDGDHDEDISKEALISKGIISKEDYEQIENYTYKLFQKGTEIAAKQGLILVDTKYEFGKTKEGKILLIDEIHTTDSSRYFYADSYRKAMEINEQPRQLSKEFVRQWLIESGFQGKEGQVIPEMTNTKVEEITARYIELYEKITGHVFLKREECLSMSLIESKIKDYFKKSNH